MTPMVKLALCLLTLPLSCLAGGIAQDNGRAAEPSHERQENSEYLF